MYISLLTLLGKKCRAAYLYSIHLFTCMTGCGVGVETCCDIIHHDNLYDSPHLATRFMFKFNLGKNRANGVRLA